MIGACGTVMSFKSIGAYAKVLKCVACLVKGLGGFFQRINHDGGLEVPSILEEPSFHCGVTIFYVMVVEAIVGIDVGLNKANKTIGVFCSVLCHQGVFMEFNFQIFAAFAVE